MAKVIERDFNADSAPTYMTVSVDGSNVELPTEARNLWLRVLLLEPTDGGRDGGDHALIDRDGSRAELAVCAWTHSRSP